MTDVTRFLVFPGIGLLAVAAAAAMYSVRSSQPSRTSSAMAYGTALVMAFGFVAVAAIWHVGPAAAAVIYAVIAEVLALTFGYRRYFARRRMGLPETLTERLFLSPAPRAQVVVIVVSVIPVLLIAVGMPWASLGLILLLAFAVGLTITEIRSVRGQRN